MKHTSKLLAIILALAMVIGLLTAMAIPAGAAGAVSCAPCKDTGVIGPELCYLCGGMCILTVGGVKPTGWAGESNIEIVTASVTVPKSVDKITDESIGLLLFTDDVIASWNLPYPEDYALAATVYIDEFVTSGSVSLTEGEAKEVCIRVDNGIGGGSVDYGIKFCITVTRSAVDEHPCINGHDWAPCADGQSCLSHNAYFGAVIPLHHTCRNCTATEACEDGNSDGKCDKCGQALSSDTPTPDKIFDWFDSWMPTWLAKTFTWITKYIFFGWLWGCWL
jgi:hypothetical protein